MEEYSYIGISRIRGNKLTSRSSAQGKSQGAKMMQPVTMQASCSGRSSHERLESSSPKLACSQKRSRLSTGKSIQAGRSQQPFKIQNPPPRQVQTHASSDDSDGDFKPNTEFGYSRKDVLLIGAGFIALGYGLYYGAQAAGIEKTTAGNYVQMFIFLIICVGYVSTYIFRVANKDMTYTKQLEQYEQRVMQKRLEEMPETERERLMEEVEKEKDRRSTSR